MQNNGNTRYISGTDKVLLTCDDHTLCVNASQCAVTVVLPHIQNSGLDYQPDKTFNVSIQPTGPGAHPVFLLTADGNTINGLVNTAVLIESSSHIKLGSSVNYEVTGVREKRKFGTTRRAGTAPIAIGTEKPAPEEKKTRTKK